MSESEWSQWLDFDEKNISQIPEVAGIFVTHANMKVLYIAGSSNIHAALLSLVHEDCVSKSKRFRYMVTSTYQDEAQKMLKDYGEKHAGKMPGCM